MQFNKKLQQLRNQKNLTQEQLANQLYVSRTAISKWENGKGYPSIDSLKCISKFFSISIDDLLSGEELMTIAQTENRSNVKKVYNLFLGILDVITFVFIILPLYPNHIMGHINFVSLISFEDTTGINLAIYWIIFVVMISLGITKLIFIHFDNVLWRDITTKSSLILNAIAMCFFTAVREPYVTFLLFLIFIIKIFSLMKQIKN